MRSFLQMLWRATLVIGLLLTFFAIIELIHAYQVLRGVHPALGYGYACILSIGLISAAVYLVVMLNRYPSVPTPPDPPTGHRQLQYLGFVLERLAGNPLLSPEQRLNTVENRRRLLAANRPTIPEPVASRIGSEVESRCILPCLFTLDARAMHEVRKGVRDVAIGVTLSPWRSMDLLLVLYRNGSMVIRISRIYRSIPGVRERMHVFRDIFRIVATVNVLNFGSKLAQNLMRDVPFIGRSIDDIAQGVGASLLTSVAGHAAVERCRPLRPADPNTIQHSVHNKIQSFLVDIRGIMVDDVIRAMNPEWAERARDGVSHAIDQTALIMDSFIRKPVFAAGAGAARIGAATWTGLFSIGRKTGGTIKATRVKLAHAVHTMAVISRTAAVRSINRLRKRFHRKNSGPTPTDETLTPI